MLTTVRTVQRKWGNYSPIWNGSPRIARGRPFSDTLGQTFVTGLTGNRKVLFPLKYQPLAALRQDIISSYTPITTTTFTAPCQPYRFSLPLPV
jgi:hypothetical protein